jgi:hypothetical protein
MTILSIDHIQLAMPPGGEEKARNFYLKILGFEEIEKPEPLRSRGGCWFKCGSAELHLGVEEDFRASKKAHPAFRVEDLELMKSYLSSKGFLVTMILPCRIFLAFMSMICSATESNLFKIKILV